MSYFSSKTITYSFIMHQQFNLNIIFNSSPNKLKSYDYTHIDSDISVEKTIYLLPINKIIYELFHSSTILNNFHQLIPIIFNKNTNTYHLQLCGIPLKVDPDTNNNFQYCTFNSSNDDNFLFESDS